MAFLLPLVLDADGNASGDALGVHWDVVAWVQDSIVNGSGNPVGVVGLGVIVSSGGGEQIDRVNVQGPPDAVRGEPIPAWAVRVAEALRDAAVLRLSSAAPSVSA